MTATPVSPNIVFLSLCNPQSILLLENLSKKLNLVGIIKIDWPSPSFPSCKEWCTTPLKTFRRWATDITQEIIYVKLTNSIARILGKDAKFPEGIPIFSVHYKEINSTKVASILENLKVDVLVVSCAPILTPTIFKIPKVCAINIHYGIAPYYRGEHTLFWPLYFRDYDNIGVTVHHIAEKVDAGNIIGQTFPRLSPKDDEAALWIKCAIAAGDVVNKFIAHLTNFPSLPTVRGQLQIDSGRNFKAKERTLLHELLLQIRKLVFRQKPRQTSERTNLYF